jgi:hypothetical protein
MHELHLLAVSLYANRSSTCAGYLWRRGIADGIGIVRLGCNSNDGLRCSKGDMSSNFITNALVLWLVQQCRNRYCDKIARARAPLVMQEE